MAFEPITYQLRVDELDAGGSFGLALRSGRLVATVVSRKTGKHVTVQLRAKRREGKRFRVCELDVAERVYVDVPSSDRGGGAEVGILHLVGKWAEKILPPWESEFDRARVWAAQRVLDVAQGRAEASDEQAEILEGKICLACGRELTDPESIARNIGPECWKRVTGLGADEGGNHQRRGEQLDLQRPSEAEVIANDKRHADIERIEVEESKSTEEAEALYAERRARGEIEDPLVFGERCAEVGEGNAEDGAMGYPVLQHPDGSRMVSVPASAVDTEVEELAGKAFDEKGDEIPEEQLRSEIEAELQETIKPPAGEEPEDLPPPVVTEGLVLLRAGDDPRRVLEETSP